MGEAKRRSTQHSVLVTQYTQYSVVGTQYSILRSIVWQLCRAWSLVVAAAVCLIIFGGCRELRLLNEHCYETMTILRMRSCRHSCVLVPPRTIASV